MTIGEASKQYDISCDTLRYYERIGLIPNVPRNKSGLRDYDQESCNWIGFIKCMRGAGMSIEALIDYVTLFKQGDSTLLARKELLLEQRKLLQAKKDNIESTINRLDYKIEHYDELIANSITMLNSKDCNCK